MLVSTDNFVPVFACNRVLSFGAARTTTFSLSVS
jgi:hypothetical protein